MFHEKILAKTVLSGRVRFFMNGSIKSVILAAGKGTRMKSEKPKVLHEIFNKPLVSWVISACENIGSNENIVVVGHKGEEVQDFINKKHPKSVCVFQKEQLGTGHAVSMAKDELKNFDGLAIILNGDIPLITAKSLQKLVEFHQSNNADITAITAILEIGRAHV